MTDQSLINSLNALLNPRPSKQLKPLDPRGAIPGKRVSASYKEKAKGTGGIASPLTETANSREYYAAVNRPSTDGLVFFSVRAVRRVHMTDANSAEVVLEFQNVTS